MYVYVCWLSEDNGQPSSYHNHGKLLTSNENYAPKSTYDSRWPIYTQINEKKSTKTSLESIYYSLYERYKFIKLIKERIIEH